MWLLFPLVVLGLGLMIVVGTGLALFAAAHALPGLLILAGVWMLVSATRGPGRRHWSTSAGPLGSGPRWSGPPPVPPRQPPPRPSGRAAAPPPDPSGQAAAPPAPPAPARPRRELPVDVQIKVEQIRHKADVLLGYAGRFPPFSRELHIVRQTAAEYLPRTVDAYLALPGDDDPVVAPSGQTALEELRAQLQLLDAKLDEIAQDLHRQDLDRLLANRRFLEERFRAIDPDEPPA